MRLVSQGAEPPVVLTDDELAHAVRRGDGSIGPALHARLNPVLRRVLRRLSGSNASDLDDLVQIAFERLITSLKKGAFRDGSDLDAWAALIATRAGIDHLRSVYRRRRLFWIGEASEPASPDASPERELELKEVRRALASLKPEHGAVLFLHDALGYDLREIAEQLELTVAATQSRLVRTRSELTRRLVAKERRTR